MQRMRAGIFTLIIGILLILPGTAMPGGKRLTATSDQLQALFVKRLVKYVTWPENISPSPGTPFVIAATDAKSLRPYFSESDHTQFRLVQWPADDFHILVVNGAPDREAGAILQRTAGMPVLTIGQSRVNLMQGVVVNFHMVGGKIKLQVNPRAAEKAGLTISSKLLRIARIYEGNENE